MFRTKARSLARYVRAERGERLHFGAAASSTSRSSHSAFFFICQISQYKNREKSSATLRARKVEKRTVSRTRKKFNFNLHGNFFVERTVFFCATVIRISRLSHVSSMFFRIHEYILGSFIVQLMWKMSLNAFLSPRLGVKTSQRHFYRLDSSWRESKCFSEYNWMRNAMNLAKSLPVHSLMCSVFQRHKQSP